MNTMKFITGGLCLLFLLLLLYLLFRIWLEGRREQISPRESPVKICRTNCGRMRCVPSGA